VSRIQFALKTTEKWEVKKGSFSHYNVVDELWKKYSYYCLSVLKIRPELSELQSEKTENYLGSNASR
jgi:hypothetical protein